MLIILNMVIAVMSSTFERVESENEAHIYREKLIAMLENMHRINSSITQRYSEHKYLLLLNIDPETDPIESETQETRLRAHMGSIQNGVGVLNQVTQSLTSSLNYLHERIDSLEKQVSEINDDKDESMHDIPNDDTFVTMERDTYENSESKKSI